jgi:hypothetical protein
MGFRDSCPTCRHRQGVYGRQVEPLDVIDLTSDQASEREDMRSDDWVRVYEQNHREWEMRLLAALADADVTDLSGDEDVIDLSGDEDVTDLSGDEDVTDLSGDEDASDLTGDEDFTVDLTEDEDFTVMEVDA